MDHALLEKLMQQLPLLEPQRPLDSVALRYAAYYGIDFSGSASQHLGRLELGQGSLAVQVWRPPQARGSLIILHGYFDHMGLYRHLIAWALRQRLAVLAFDLPGHGLSSGERASISCFSQYQQALDAVLREAALWQLPAPWHVLGQSTGSAILIDRLLHGDLPGQWGETVLLAPLVRPQQWRASRLGLRMFGRFTRQFGRRFRDNSGDLAFLQFIREQDPLQPRVLPVAWLHALDQWIAHIEQAPPSTHSPLVVQGQLDTTVDWRYNLRVLESKFANIDPLLLPQARHHLVNEQDSLRGHYLQWLEGKLQLRD